jgi:pimeloyl-ACP methyl ester carboxylesterase
VIGVRSKPDTPRRARLQVPGADLYYEVRGGGPLLLMIPGGSGDADPYAAVVVALADRYTVVSYDRRGFSRSWSEAPPRDDRRFEIDGDDARRLIEHLVGAPAFVFGSSSGTIVGLDVLTRYPSQVRALVAHEPLLVTLLPDATEQLAFADQVYDTYRRSGVGAALQSFFPKVGARGLPGQRRLGLMRRLARFSLIRRLAEAVGAPIHLVDMLARIQANQPFWLEHELRQYIRYSRTTTRCEPRRIGSSSPVDATPAISSPTERTSRWGSDSVSRSSTLAAATLATPRIPLPLRHASTRCSSHTARASRHRTAQGARRETRRCDRQPIDEHAMQIAPCLS